MRVGSGLCPRCNGSGLVDGIPCPVCSTQSMSTYSLPKDMSIEDFANPERTSIPDADPLTFAQDTGGKRAVAVLREDAGVSFDFDGFGIDESREVVHTLEEAGHVDPVWILGTSIADQIRETVDRIVWEEGDGGMPTAIDTNPVYESDTLRDDEAFCIGPRAVSPTSKYVPVGPPIVVRRPDGVARVTL